MPDFGEVANGRKDIERLLQFLRSTYEILSDLIRTGRDPKGQPMFTEELLIPMQSAWDELSPHFRLLEKRILELKNAQIQQHGFSGQQLNFKLSVVSSIWNRFLTRGGTRLLRKLLGAIDGVLGSLIEATGAGGAIREIKEAIENSTSEE